MSCLRPLGDDAENMASQKYVTVQGMKGL